MTNREPVVVFFFQKLVEFDRKLLSKITFKEIKRRGL